MLVGWVAAMMRKKGNRKNKLKTKKTSKLHIKEWSTPSQAKVNVLRTNLALMFHQLKLNHYGTIIFTS